MELFIADFNNDFKDGQRGLTGDFKDVCDWYGIDCNAERRVTGITYTRGISPCPRGVSVSLDMLPKDLLFLVLWCENQNFTGTLNASLLPQHLTNFNLTETKFAGTVDFTAFPGTNRGICIDRGLFEGTVDLTHLPKPLRRLKLKQNRFFGSLNLESLPANIHVLDLSRNNFEGRVSLYHLPPALIAIHLGGNYLRGYLDPQRMPASIVDYFLSIDFFDDTVDLKSLVKIRGVHIDDRRRLSPKRSDFNSSHISTGRPSTGSVAPQHAPHPVEPKKGVGRMMGSPDFNDSHTPIGRPYTGCKPAEYVIHRQKQMGAEKGVRDREQAQGGEVARNQALPERSPMPWGLRMLFAAIFILTILPLIL